MLLDRRLATVVFGLLAVTAVSAACTDLVIDDFSKWVEGTNNLNWPNGDDGSMTSIAAAAGKVQFIPKDGGSYFYESFSCQQAITLGYGGIQFTLQGPAGGSVAFELQTSASCNASDTGNYTSSYNVISGLTGSQQTIDLPLLGFDNNPNYDAIVGLVWSEFSQTNAIWSVGNIKLTCGAVAVPTTTAAPTTQPSSTTRSVVPTSTTRSVITTVTRSSASPTATACSNLLIDDWESQSRLTFLGYNAMNQASSDDGTMSSIVVSNHRVLLTPKNQESYFYSQFGCLNTNDKYGGISFRIRAARGTTFAVQMSYFATCGSSTGRKTISMTSTQLKWTFDGTERLYYFPFSVFTGLDTTKLDMIYFSSFNAAVIFGPMSFYCGSTASEYILPSLPPPANTGASPTVPAPSSNAKPFVIDTFTNKDTNNLGQWHGGDDGMTVIFGKNSITIRTNDSDLGWNTQLASTCFDMTPYSTAYLHVAFTGSSKFSIALQQHNAHCDDSIKPYPETWDSLEAARYSFTTEGKSDIYIPISHFHINLTRTIGFNLRGFFSPSESTVITKMEIIPSVPPGISIPHKLPSGTLVFACTRPNSFAFAIDDGDPKLASRVMSIVSNANIPVTFFTVGLPLLDPSTNLSKIYRDMASKGHQIALHSYTHPKMEGLPTIAGIDWEYQNDIGAVRQTFPSSKISPYFRPPFGTEGARMRQRLVENLGRDDKKAYIVGWSVDVEDWLWAESETPEKQLEAFKRDLKAGGNLVVMHYLYESTVGYLEEFIQLAKASGKRLMRVDQCMEDPEAPPLT
ncbi:glycoside hydrolase/deacetylase [Neurospora crassa]|nr:glycoside hydrolase/deacetylase [Neurospora crassa]